MAKIVSTQGKKKARTTSIAKKSVSKKGKKEIVKVPKEGKKNKSKHALQLPNSIAQNGKWTEDEHKLFLEALEKYGNCWKLVEQFIGTRSCAQIRSHAQKYFRKLRKNIQEELRSKNQLKNKVFIVIKEYYNYASFLIQSKSNVQQQPTIDTTPYQQSSINDISEESLESADKNVEVKELENSLSPQFEEGNYSPSLYYDISAEPKFDEEAGAIQGEKSRFYYLPQGSISHEEDFVINFPDGRPEYQNETEKPFEPEESPMLSLREFDL